MSPAVDPAYRSRIPVYLFVGEKRSQTAIRNGWSWYDQRLAGKTLAEALEACGVSRVGPPYAAYYEIVNFWKDDGTEDFDAARTVIRRVVHGWTIGALGQKVAKALQKEDIPYLVLRHPAARGAGRKRERYQQHVAEVLGRVYAPEMTEVLA